MNETSTDKCDRPRQPRHLGMIFLDLYLKYDYSGLALIGACIAAAPSAQAQNVDSAPSRSRVVVSSDRSGTATLSASCRRMDIGSPTHRMAGSD